MLPKGIREAPTEDRLSVVILAASPGRQMKSYGPRSLIRVAHGETVVARQIRLIQAIDPKAEIVVVVGYQAYRYRRILPEWVQLVVNEDYENNQTATSAAMGVKACRTNRVLIMSGDLVFGEDFLEGIRQEGSVLLTSYEMGVGKMAGSEVGICHDHHTATYMTYGLKGIDFPPWSQIAILSGLELDLFRQLSPFVKPKVFLFELLNAIIERKGRFRVHLASGPLVEIDKSKDINLAREIS